ncbi:MAG: hypothetical protein HOP06_06750 [Methylotenera sp.]|nr:hypothetical protein [Methylotenera sp.]
MIQQSFWNGRLIEEKLGAYVYALIDPQQDEVFYIGLAGGLNEQGNNRPIGHLNETSEAISKELHLNAKQTKIKEIWDRGQEVKLAIIRRSLNRDEAKHVEASLIDLLSVVKSSGSLTNIVRGHGTDKHSLVNETNNIDIMANPVNPNLEVNNVWLFNISNAIDRGENPYEATIGDWIIGNEHCQIKEDEPQYAIGLNRGVSRVVILISKWGVVLDNKKKIMGENINESEIGKQLLEKDFSQIITGVGFWQRGRPIRVNLKKDEFTITYGVVGGRSGQY